MTQIPADTKSVPKNSEPPRTPIPVEKLLITHANPHGVKLPDGAEGRGEKLQHTINAGETGELKIEIDYMPWVRAFRVKRSKKVVRDVHSKDGKVTQSVTWTAMGKPFYLHETWAAWIPVGE